MPRFPIHNIFDVNHLYSPSNIVLHHTLRYLIDWSIKNLKFSENDFLKVTIVRQKRLCQAELVQTDRFSYSFPNKL